MRKILIVDDSSMDMQFGKRALVSAGVLNELLEARTGEEAMQIVGRCEGPMLVLLDLKMPPPDGLEVLRFIRKHKSKSDVQVVAVTGGLNEEQSGILLGMGVKHVLSKPFYFPDLHPVLLDLGRHLIID